VVGANGVPKKNGVYRSLSVIGEDPFRWNAASISDIPSMAGIEGGCQVRDGRHIFMAYVKNR
jgi:hypothetical protein